MHESSAIPRSVPSASGSVGPSEIPVCDRAIRHSDPVIGIFAALCVGFCVAPTIAATVRAEAVPYGRLVEARSHAQYGGDQPISWVENCSDARRDLGVDGASFETTYPNGLLVICDNIVRKRTATLVVMRYLFNVSKKDVLLSSFVEVGLSETSNAWHITKWRITHRDYAP